MWPMCAKSSFYVIYTYNLLEKKLPNCHGNKEDSFAFLRFIGQAFMPPFSDGLYEPC